MSTRLLVLALWATLGLAFVGCEMMKPAPGSMVTTNDHAGLANYYKGQAQELREKAKSWDMLADSYERHGAPSGKMDPKQHAAHCKTIADSYRQAAAEADALATEHRGQLPHGMMQ